MADKKMTVTLPFPLDHFRKPSYGVEFQRYHEGSRVLVDSRIVPHLRLFEGADGQASLVLDGRFGVDGTEDEIRKWVCFVAHAMAVAAGYSCFGEQSAPMQKNLTETGNECMRQLKSQRDEAREQLRATTERLQDAEKRCNHGGEHPRCQCDDEMIRRLVASGDTLAIELHKAHKRVEAAQTEAQAATARAEEMTLDLQVSERSLALAEQDRATLKAQLAKATDTLGTERAARVAAEAEVRHLKALNADYVKTHRVVTEGLNARLAAAEAEVGRLQLALNDSIDRYKTQVKQIAAAEAEAKTLTTALAADRAICYDPDHAALRERCRRLEEAGDKMASRVRSYSSMMCDSGALVTEVAAWAIAKGEVPNG